MSVSRKDVGDEYIEQKEKSDNMDMKNFMVKGLDRPWGCA